MLADLMSEGSVEESQQGEDVDERIWKN
jgi:hypothetical protein